MLILLIIALLPIIYTDFKARYVYSWSVAVYLSVAAAYFIAKPSVTLLEGLISFAALLVIAAAAVSVTYLRNRKKLSLKDIAGAGDLLFFLPVPFLLPLKLVVIYLICTCIAALILSQIKIFRGNSNTIPLAGWGAVILPLFLIL